MGSSINNEFLKKHLNVWQFILTVLCSAGAFYVSTGFYNIWILTWLAPLPLCIYALKSSYRNTFFAGFFAFFIGTANQFGYLHPQTYFAISAASAFAYALLLVIYRYAAIRGEHWSAGAIFASGWTACEFMTSLFSSYGTFHSVAYTQIANLLVIQIASVTGIWGITFLLMLMPASIALMWHYRQNRNMLTKISIIPVFLLVITLLFGYFRWHFYEETLRIKIGVAAVPATREQMISKDPRQIQQTISQYAKCVEMLASAGAEAVLLPEKLAVLALRDEVFWLEQLADIAQKNKVTLIAGLTNRNEAMYNSAYVFSPTGQLMLKYNKQHLLRPFEASFTPGDVLGIIKTTDMGAWGVEICKDMDFTRPSLEYAKQGIGIVFVPALDFHVDGWLHARVAIMRGVEGNYAVTRGAQWGLLSLSDARGNVVAKVSTDASNNETLLLGELPLGTGQSIYSRWGDWFAWSCVAVFTCYCLSVLARKNSI